MERKGMCYKCGKTIYRDGCTALNQLYHTECFSCYVCGKSSTNSGFEDSRSLIAYLFYELRRGDTNSEKMHKQKPDHLG